MRQILKEIKWNEYAIVLIIFLGAFVVRVAALKAPMRYDESFTFLYYVSRGFTFIVTDYFRPNNHIFHSLLVWWSTLLLGIKPWAIRLPAFVAGLLSVIVTYWAGKTLFNKSTAFVASIIIAFSTTMITYSANARGYSIVCLFTVLLIICANWIRTNKPKSWVLFVLLGIFGLYTIPIMIYPLGSILMWIFLEKRMEAAKPLLLAIFSIITITFILYMPIFLTSGILYFIKIAGHKTWAAAGWSQLCIEIWKQWTINYPIWLQVLTFFGFVTGLILYKSSFKIPLVFPCLLFCVPVLIIQQNLPPARTWLPFLPIFAITTANGITRLSSFLFKKGSGVIVVFLAFIYISVAPLTVKSLKDPYLYDSEVLNEAAIFLKNELTNDDKLLLNNLIDLVVTYYLLLYDGPTENIVATWAGNSIEDILNSKRIIMILSRTPEEFGIVKLGSNFLKPQCLKKIADINIYELTSIQEENLPIYTGRRLLTLRVD